MYRFSNGTYLTFGNGLDGKGYVIVYGTNSIINPSYQSFWSRSNLDEGKVIYWRRGKGQLIALEKNLSIDVNQIIQSELSNLTINEIHPSLTNGLQNDAVRLFPSLHDVVLEEYHEFLSFLESEFMLSKNLEIDQDLEPYSEDIGPCLLGKVNEEYFLLPEIPRFYLAPDIWSKLTVMINNSFSGPYPNNFSNDAGINQKRFDWGNLHLDASMKTDKVEGLAYYLITKFIISHEAWMNRPSADSLRLFFELLMKQGHRPWRVLY